MIPIAPGKRLNLSKKRVDYGPRIKLDDIFLPPKNVGGGAQERGGYQGEQEDCKSPGRKLHSKGK